MSEIHQSDDLELSFSNRSDIFHLKEHIRSVYPKVHNILFEVITKRSIDVFVNSVCELMNKKLVYVSEKPLKLWYLFYKGNWIKIGYLKLKRIIFKQFYTLLKKCVIKNSTYSAITECISLYESKFHCIRAKLEARLCDKKFESKLDCNPSVLVFDNGLLNLNNFKFRKVRSSDMITYSTNINFIEKHDDKMKNLMEFLIDIQPNRKELDYLLTLLGSMLYQNTFGIYTLFMNTHRAYLYRLMKLLRFSLGDYYGRESPAHLRYYNSKFFNRNRAKKVVFVEKRYNMGISTEIIKLITDHEPIHLIENRNL